MKTVNSTILMIFCYPLLIAQTHLEIQGNTNSMDTLLKARVNYSGQTDVMGLHVYSAPAGENSAWGIGAKVFGGWRGVWGHSMEGAGLYGESLNSTGGWGYSQNYCGILGQSENHYGVYGVSETTVSIFGESQNSIGVRGSSINGSGVAGSSISFYGVYGESTQNAGVYAESQNSNGVRAHSVQGSGVYGTSQNLYGLRGESENNAGIYGNSISSIGVLGQSDSSTGVQGSSGTGVGIMGLSNGAEGVKGFSTNGMGIFGESTNNVGVLGESLVDYGVHGTSNSSYGLYGESTNAIGAYIVGYAINLELGGTNYINGGGGDEGVITSQRDLPNSDLFLISNDGIFFELDNNGDEVGEFEIWNGNNELVFRVDEFGNVSVNGVMVHASDKNRKTNLSDVDFKSILNRIEKLPIQYWNYIDDASWHIGPMAQDFYAAFGLGFDDKGIATVDADGVALAAIKALIKENKELKAGLRQQQEDMKELNRQMEQILQKISLLDSKL